MIKTFAIAGALALGASVAANAATQWTGPGANGHYYELKQASSALTWTQARDAAAALTFGGSAGYLATVTSAGEQNFISSLNPSDYDAWLGGTDEASEGNWTWVTGESWTYSNWAGGEPNNCCGGEDYLIGWWSGDAWNDLPNSSVYNTPYYVVEYDPAPVPLPAGLPLVLAGLGALGVVGRIKRRA